MTFHGKEPIGRGAGASGGLLPSTRALSNLYLVLNIPGMEFYLLFTKIWTNLFITN
jgi:hypothetical protein